LFRRRPACQSLSFVMAGRSDKMNIRQSSFCSSLGVIKRIFKIASHEARDFSLSAKSDIFSGNRPD